MAGKSKSSSQRNYKLSIVSTVLFCFITVAALGQESKQKDSFLEFLDGNWVTEYTSTEGDVVNQDLSFRWSEHERYLRMQDTHTISGTYYQSHDGFFGKLAQTGKLTFHFVSSKGVVIGLLEQSREKDMLVMHGDVHGDPKLEKLQLKLTILTDSSFKADVFYNSDGKWNLLNSATFIKKTTKEKEH